MIIPAPTPLLLMPPTHAAPGDDSSDWQITDITPAASIINDTSKALIRIAIEHLDEHGNVHYGASCLVTIDWAECDHDDACRAAIEHLIKKHDDHIQRQIDRDEALYAELDAEEEEAGK